ncbi:hypothetical protein CF319_g8013 [Tilletia indica]|nr:hypothetical protein CF319_g8013 [Tilletia indica]
MAIQTPINTPANGAAGGGGAGGGNPYLNPPPAPGRPTAAAATTTPANQHHNDSNSNSFHHQNNNNNNNFSDSTAISHLSISGASSSGLDGSLAGFSLFGRALPPPSGSQSQPQQAQTQGPRSTMMQQQQQQPRRVLPSNGIFGTQSHAALAAMLASSQSESSLVSASGETGTGGESSFSASLSFPNRVGGRPVGAQGGGGGGGRGGAGNNLGLVPTNGPWPGLLAPGSQARTHSIPMLSSSTPALTQGSAAAAGTSMSAMSQQSTSQADQAHSGGGIASSSRTQQLYHQHDSQTMGGVGGETQHSLFPANSTSADSMMHSYDEQDEVEKENRVQTELQHLSNARGRDLHLKAHIQLGLSIPTAKAPILDPLVQIILPESASTRTQPSAPGPALLPLPLPSPAETASLRDRAYLAQRRTQIRESLVRSHVLVELDNIALEHDRQRLRTAIQEQSKRWAANRELKRRRKMAGGGPADATAAVEEGGKEGERSQGEIVPSSSWSTVDGGGPEGSAPVEVNSGPSALTPHQRSELKTLLRASPGLDGKAAGSQPHRNAVAMLNNENRHASFFLQQQVASSEPLLTDWAYAPPAPGSYSSTTTTARRTLSAAAPPVVRKPSHQDNDADDPADDDDDEGKKSLLLLLGASNRKDGSASSEAWFFSSRQRGAELGSFAPAWDVGPSQKSPAALKTVTDATDGNALLFLPTTCTASTTTTAQATDDEEQHLTFAQTAPPSRADVSWWADMRAATMQTAKVDPVRTDSASATAF